VFVDYSEEDDIKSDNKQSSPGAKNVVPTMLRFCAECHKYGDGGVHLTFVRVTDSTGTVGYACCIVTVSGGNEVMDLERVEAQGNATLDL
tara:strand:- start:1181 stop:1450 length:270 start_codon:yes stop_codon:yes gene_type:complete